MSGKLLAISWIGSKYSHLNWLLPLLPPNKVYIEPFGGGAAVLLNRLPSELEIYNDLDGSLCNFFRVLRDRPKELIRKLEWTPWAREEYAIAYSSEESCDDLERARRFFVRSEQSFTHIDSKGWRRSTQRSRFGAELNRIRKFYKIAKRLRGVQIEHENAIKCILDYDSPDTLFYVDPPYQIGLETQNPWYCVKFGVIEHQELAKVLKKMKGKVAVSGYSGLFDDLYDGFYVHKASPKVATSSRNSHPDITNEMAMRQEILWTNYVVPEGGFHSEE